MSLVDHKIVFYATPRRNVMRVVGLVLVVIVVVPTVVLGIVMTLNDSAAWPMVLLSLVMVVVFLPLVLLLTRPRFVVSTHGLMVVNVLRSFHVWWSEVETIDVEQSYLWRGATVIRCKDSRRIVARVTAAWFAVRRGESTGHHGQDLREPARPTLVAQQVHARFLSGELLPAPG